MTIEILTVRQASQSRGTLSDPRPHREWLCRTRLEMEGVHWAKREFSVHTKSPMNSSSIDWGAESKQNLGQVYDRPRFLRIRNCQIVLKDENLASSPETSNLARNCHFHSIQRY